MTVNRVQSLGKVRTFKDLYVWQKAHHLALEIYRQTTAFPKQELYGLTNQIRRAAVSTAANIVEGSRRKSRIDFAHFLNIAQGSNEEVKYYIILSKDLQLLPDASAYDLLQQADEVGAILFSFVRKLKSVT